jgi:hypothetical protein
MHISFIVIRNIQVPRGRAFFISGGRRRCVLPVLTGREKNPGPALPGRENLRKGTT